LALALTDGMHSITAEATDLFNNKATSGPLVVTIDTFVAVNTTPDMTAATDSGINNDNITNDNTPTFTGMSEAPGDYIELLVDGVPVAVTPSPGPGTGGNSGGGGVWTVTPVAAIPNGAHVITTRVTDIAGNQSESSPLNIVIDTIASAVNAVRVGSTAWNANFVQVADPTALDIGYLIPAGAAQLDVLPWTNINQIMLTFTEATVVAQADLRLRGVNTANYDGLIAAGTFSYNPITLTATWTLSATLPVDRYLISLNDTATDTAGSALDGEWADGVDAFPSGNGTAGGEFNFTVNILPGDANRSGSVLGGDVTQIQVRQFESTTGGVSTPMYTIFHDLNGSASILGNDVTLAQVRQFDTLPAGSPSPPALMASLKAAASAALSTGRSLYRPPARQPIVRQAIGAFGSAERDVAIQRLLSERAAAFASTSQQDAGGENDEVFAPAVDAAFGDIWN
jgi:hypothetical protein